MDKSYLVAAHDIVDAYSKFCGRNGKRMVSVMEATPEEEDFYYSKRRRGAMLLLY